MDVQTIVDAFTSLQKELDKVQALLEDSESVPNALAAAKKLENDRAMEIVKDASQEIINKLSNS